MDDISDVSIARFNDSPYLRPFRMQFKQCNRKLQIFLQFGFNVFPDIMRPFNTQYRAYSVSMIPGNERRDVEAGGKIIMPPSALDQLTRLNIEYPMLFKLTNKNTDRVTHCGVLEFVADEGKIYLPFWMMTNLLLEEGGLIKVESVSLPVATFSKFQPQAPDFLDITNPKAVLENALRSFACLTSGDVIAIKYNEKIYELCVLETRPGKAVSIIECDMNVEFAAPIGYQEPRSHRQQPGQEEETPMDDIVEADGFVPFAGEGNRLDGKERSGDLSPVSTPQGEQRRGIPNCDYNRRKLTFIREVRPINNTEAEEKELQPFEAFKGEGQSLKQKRTTAKN
ncbi:PREDICTED: ubiquitin fusion degradation protein 1 homolog [Priapulus caudatus]|uniref:Ubiquitin fusion degradation protein 1 homolog n=1 Tax=Priapulus caudatus TaxID=37621 RepID=A0ABM1EQS1_PRICU|nr:PREDICTED: ubiquitin fusion degradation protein 1 homolog [Priapulus caudatus]